ncbi:MAG TPA: hypothetical protein H9892_00740 [Candidatus Protoclostridium stercorigallinarum]|uniref:Uncharacterized protein n=1 Tax=Candidatus Protoclostridium stercorigallinarum TaxID=2838741 RepID=A0A9D1Q0C4_9FIRM|nr:hypothetical protein [Candidatus Protoclostridium stercorigallinarum]
MDKKKGADRVGSKLEIAIPVVAGVMLLFALFFPLIIWDALGAGAMHFMQYSGVAVAGSSAGDSKATFFFGLDYTLSHLGSGFIPAQLFSAQWRVVLDTTEASAAADGLGVITMILTVLLFVTPLLMIAGYVVDKILKKPITRKIAKYLAIVCAGIEMVTFIWFAIIVFTMAGKVQPYGFRTFDFMAYGGIKFVIEMALCAALCALNTLLFVRILKEEKSKKIADPAAA